MIQKLDKTFLALTVFSASTALAGENLHFKSATIDAAKTDSSMRVMSVEEQAQAQSTSYYVVQFKETITEKDRQGLEKLGVKIYRYIPDDALLVKGDPQKLRHLSAKNKSVRVTVPFLSQFKLSPQFGPRSVFTAQFSQQVQVYLLEKELNDSVREKLNAMGGVRVLEGTGKVLGVSAPLSALDEIARIEGVEFIQPKAKFELLAMDLGLNGMQTQMMAPAGEFTGYETGTYLMGFDNAWDRGLTGEGQIVAMADTGLDTGHLPGMHADFGNVFGGQAFGLFAKSWEDPNGHGTHVAGSVMGSGAASGGYLLGGAFGSHMYAQGMWSPVMGNITPPTDLSEMFDDANSAGARIHTNSWGSAAAGMYTGASAQVDEYMWEYPDFLILFAAGNSGIDMDGDGVIDPDSIGSPATAKNALTVGASENYVFEGGIQKQLKEVRNGEPWGAEPLGSDRLSDNPNGIAAFSSRGPTNDNRIKPDVVAPGTNIVSVCSTHAEAGNLWGRLDNNYCFSGGTSMSTPLVAGAAAVVRQALVETTTHENPSAALIKGILMATATDLYPGQYGEGQGQEMLVPGPNNQQGYGRVNVALATHLDYIEIVDEQIGVRQGRGAQYVFDAGVTKVTLVYTDAPGSPSAAKALVNNLDLRVQLPDGTTYRSQSQVNNSEQIRLGQRIQGPVTVTVEGVNIPHGRNGALPYALIVSR